VPILGWPFWRAGLRRQRWLIAAFGLFILKWALLINFSSAPTRRLEGASAWRDAAVGVFGILWRVVSTGRAFWIYQLTGCAAADHTSNSPNRSAYQYTNRPCNSGTNGCTCSHAGHDATPNQDGL
jgi:hypothetical protein